MRIGILGGGISAVTLQRHLKHPSEIMESSPSIGGLCRTITTPGGFSYDIGGHISFSKHEYVTDLVKELLGDNIRYGRRDSRILYKSKLVKYPFANGFGVLDPQEVYECLTGFLDRPFGALPPTNLEEWFIRTYGKGIASKNLVPYSSKVWKLPCSQLSCGFISRIPPPPTDDVIKTALGIETEGYTEQLNFIYPKVGGFEALVKAMHGHPRANETCDFPVGIVRWDGDGWLVGSSHGKLRGFERIVITFPLHQAIRCFRDVPADVLTAVKDLIYNSLIVVFVAIDHEKVMPYNALYVADPDILFHRVCPTAAYSDSLVHPGTCGLTAEITCRRGDGTYEMTDNEVIARVLTDLHGLGLLDNRDNVIETHVTRAEYSYPVYDLMYDENIKKVRSYFNRINVPLLGRSGNFEYINSDECIHRAIQLANRLNEEE